MTDIVFDVFWMNPKEIEIILKLDFDFHGFSRYDEGRLRYYAEILFVHSESSLQTKN